MLMCGSVSCSDVAGRRALALAAGQREGGLALRLSEAAGEAGEGFDQRASVCDGHLPEFELLSARPLLRRVLIHLPPLAQVTLIPQHHHHHLHTHTQSGSHQTTAQSTEIHYWRMFAILNVSMETL